MKMQIICGCTASRTLLAVSLIVYVLCSSTTANESQGKNDHSEKWTHEEDKYRSAASSDDRKTGNSIGIQGDQLIYCEGDLSSCHNVLTNIICSNVKYCIVGDVTPFVMSNPL